MVDNDNPKNPTTPPPKDEFDTFLGELSATPVRGDMDQKEVMAHMQMLELEWDKTLDEVGYEKMTLGSEAYVNLTNGISEQMIKAGVTDSEQIRAQISRSFALITMRYQFFMINILKTRAAFDFSFVRNAYDPEKEAEAKRQLYAGFLVNEHMQPDDKLLQAFNTFMPGDTIHPDDDALMPHLLNAYETLANNSSADEERGALTKRFRKTLDIPEDAPIHIQLRFSYILFTAINMPLSGKGNDLANRTERIHTLARNEGIDMRATHKIIDFIDDNFPLES